MLCIMCEDEGTAVIHLACKLAQEFIQSGTGIDLQCPWTDDRLEDLKEFGKKVNHLWRRHQRDQVFIHIHVLFNSFNDGHVIASHQEHQAGVNFIIQEGCCHGVLEECQSEGGMNQVKEVGGEV